MAWVHFLSASNQGRSGIASKETELWNGAIWYEKLWRYCGRAAFALCDQSC